MTLEKIVNGVRIELTEKEESDLRAEWVEIKAKKDAIQYQSDRRNAYPSYADQFDQIFHEGIDKWKETIQAVKDAHPKP